MNFLGDIEMVTSEDAIMERIENHIDKIIMYSRILQAYRMPLLSFKEIRELEAKIMAEYAE